MRNPIRMMIIGVVLMILGVIFPLLMVIRIIESSFWLSFLSYGFSLVGMVMAFFGLFSFMAGRRKQ